MAQGGGDDGFAGASRESSGTQSAGGVLPDELGLDGGEALKESLNDKAGLDIAFELGVASLRRYCVIRLIRNLIAT